MSELRLSPRGGQLTPGTFDELVTEAQYRGSGQWHPSAKEGLLFDLSRLTWVDPGALAQLALIAMRGLRDGVRVSIAMPSLLPGLAESRRLRPARMQTRLDNRKAVREFLQYMQFPKCLGAGHLRDFEGKLRVLENFDFDSPDVAAEHGLQDALEAQSERTYRYHLPLSWLGTADAGALAEHAGALVRLLGDPTRGFQSLQAETIANVIFRELVDNALTHSRSGSSCLIAAWASLPKSLLGAQRRSRRGQPQELDFLAWAGSSGSGLVEVFVGDDGVGIHSTLKEAFKDARRRGAPAAQELPDTPESIVAWAFDRWSTSRGGESERRGTRGLYRLDRVVKKLQGCVTLQSGPFSVTWDHGGPSFDKLHRYRPARLAERPGTFARVRLPAFQKSRAALQHSRRGQGRAARENEHVPTMKVIELGALRSEGIDAQGRALLMRAVGETPASSWLVAHVSGGECSRRALEDALSLLTQVRHPHPTIVVGLPGGWELVEGAIDSINQDLQLEGILAEARSPDRTSVSDPVLVLGPGGEIGWAGVPPGVAELLGSATLGDGRFSASLEPGGELQSLRVDSEVLGFESEGTILLYQSMPRLAQIVSEAIRRSIRERLAGTRKGGPFLTPALRRVSTWLDPDVLVRSSVSREIALIVLAWRCRAMCEGPGRTPSALIHEDSEDDRNGRNLAELLQLRPVAAAGESAAGKSAELARSHLGPGESACLYVDVLVSGAGIRRTAEQLLQRGNSVSFVACLVDGRREASTGVEVLDTNIPVFSVVRETLETDATGSCVIIHPHSKQPESGTEAMAGRGYGRLEFEQILRVCEGRDALRLDHVGNPIGRHFTFYLDVEALISEPVLRGAFVEAARHLLGSAGRNDDTEVWYPTSEAVGSVAAAERLAEEVSRALGFSARGIPRRPDGGRWSLPSRVAGKVPKQVLVVDWGAVSGSTVEQMAMLAARAGCDSVLSLVFLSQMTAQEEAFTRAVRSLGVLRRAEPDGEQIELDLGGAHEVGDTAKGMECLVSARFEALGFFPIAVYDPLTCPACKIARELDSLHFPTVLLRECALSEAKRYHQVSREKLLSRVRSTTQDERTLILEAVRWRHRLVAALTSTKARKDVLDRLVEAAGCERWGPASEEAALVWLLEYERHWLDHPPLQLPNASELVAVLAAGVAGTREVPRDRRLGAVWVLKCASIETFAERLYMLFEGADDAVRRCLLLAACSAFEPLDRQILSRWARAQVRSSLDRIRTLGLESVAGEKAEFRDTIDGLISRVSRADSLAEIASQTPREVWRALRELVVDDSGQTHHSLSYQMETMRVASERRAIDAALAAAVEGEDVVARIPPELCEILSVIPDNWRGCCEFLDGIATRLRGIRKIVGNELGHSLGRGGDKERWLSFVDDERPISERDLAKLVRGIASDLHGLLRSDRWEYFKSEVDWLASAIVAIDPPSRLRTWVLSCPASVFRAFRAAVGESRVQHGGRVTVPEEDLAALEGLPSVFATDELLRDLAHEILSNAVKHAAPEGTEAIAVGIVAEIQQDLLRIVFRYRGTRASKRPGQGLAGLRARLSAFGGDLNEIRIEPDSEVTFELEVLVQVGWEIR